MIWKKSPPPDNCLVSAPRLSQQIGVPTPAVLAALAILGIEPARRLGETNYYAGGTKLRLEEHFKPKRKSVRIP